MEWAVSATTATATPGQFPQVSGMAFAFDPTRQPMTYLRADTTITGIDNPGQRLRSLVAARADGSLDLVVENGVLVGDPTRTFRMVTLDFLATGGDSYFPLTLGTSVVNLVPAGVTKTFDTDGGEQRALADYLGTIGTYMASDTPRALDSRIQHLGFRADSTLRPAITGIRLNNNTARVRFTTLPGKTYTLDAQDSILGTWSPVGVTLNGNGLEAELDDASAGAADLRLYRVRY